MAPRGALRILVVGERFPWPQDHGAGMRLANVITGLSALGEVELFAFVHRGDGATCTAPSEAPVSRVGVAARPEVRVTRRLRLAWLAGGRLPLELYGRDHHLVRSAFRAWERGPYDLAWFGDPETFVALGPLVGAPSIVDFDDLEDQTLWLKGQDATPAGNRGPVRRAARGVADAERHLRHSKNRRRWRKLRVNAARSGAALAVCSELDRTRVGLDRAVVVPNGYAAPAQPLGRVEVGDPPTILLPGYLRYGPNIDAAQRLVHDIAPHLWAAIPDLQIRLVGLGDVRARRLHRPPQVVVTGRVDDMATELRRADVLAVPLRHAGGTRIKILEAFAHRIPVVSTAVGAEGLEVFDGEHLLLRDAPEEFAAACLLLLRDEDLRSSLAASAAELFHRRYRWDQIHRQLAHLGAQLIDAGPRSSGGPPGSNRSKHRVR